MAIAFVREDGVSGTSLTFDIGTAGTDRLVVIFAADEHDQTPFLSDVTVDSISCSLEVTADNDVGIGNHSELWYIE